jgi:hypothetical protein
VLHEAPLQSLLDMRQNGDTSTIQILKQLLLDSGAFSLVPVATIGNNGSDQRFPPAQDQTFQPMMHLMSMATCS